MNQNKNDIGQKLKALTDTRVLSLIAFGVVALLVTWSGVKVIQKNYELDKKITISNQKNEVKKLENENMRLKNEYFRSAQYLELSARRQFGKAAPGERLYVVPESVALSKTIEIPNDQKITATNTTVKSKAQRNFDAWMNFLF